MTTNHKELCERLISDIGKAILGEGTESLALVLSRCAALLQSQAARIQQQEERIAELEKERDALKADAARYRWLRDFGKDGVNLKPPCEHVYTLLYSHPAGVIPASRVIAGDELDRAIEAALQAEKETR